MRGTRLRSPHGFTLIEVMVAALVVSIGALGAVTLVNRANANTVENNERQAGVAINRNIIEQSRTIPFGELSKETVEERVQRTAGLRDAEPGDPWTVRRGRTTYTISADVCSLDDPKDGLGPHGSGQFCSDSAALAAGAACNPCDYSGEVDGNSVVGGGTPEDYKRVTITISWGGRSSSGAPSDSYYVKQSTLIANPGNAGGPAVTEFGLYSDSALTTALTAGSPITDAAVTTLYFKVKTSLAADQVKWSVNGITQGPTTGQLYATPTDSTRQTWTFSWNVPNGAAGLQDGPYMVAVQASDANGFAGSPRSTTVVFNRNAPAAPNGFAAGRVAPGSATVDFEWLPNPEKDIVGYRVYRTTDPSATSGTVVCLKAGQTVVKGTSCQSTSEPTSGTYYYFVRAVDRDAGGAERVGAASPIPAKPLPANTNAPQPPTNLSARVDVSAGTAVLCWTPPAQLTDPDDPSDRVAFYRIYRDGTAYEDRYDRTSGSPSGCAPGQLSYTDRDRDGRRHSYWITSVDSHLAESTKVGEVTL